MASPTTPTTVLRTWRLKLLSERGDQPGWPKLVCWTLEETFPKRIPVARVFTREALASGGMDHDA